MLVVFEIHAVYSYPVAAVIKLLQKQSALYLILNVLLHNTSHNNVMIYYLIVILFAAVDFFHNKIALILESPQTTPVTSILKHPKGNPEG